MKNILLPTDFSENAWNAIFTALKLYSNIACKFYLLNAYEPNTLNLLGRKSQERLGIIYDSLAQHSQLELEKVLGYLEEHHQNTGHSFETISVAETLEEAVEETVTSKDIDLIVMGTQGATGAKEVFMGSNTVKLLKSVKSVPILVVPSGHDFKSLKTFAFSTDFNKSYSKFELKTMLELAKHWQTKIQILHVAVEFALNEQQKVNQEQLKERLKEVGMVIKNIEFEANVAHSLQNYLSENRVDLMALIRYQHSFWEKIIREAVVKKLSFHAKVPLLILPES
ncbi:MAG: universal stress protein [Flavobacteriaceae bacterium]